MFEKKEAVISESRRSFLKKAAYTAPAVVALGALTAPMSAHASLVFHQQTIYNTKGVPASVTERYDNVGLFTQDGTFTPDRGVTTYISRQDIVTAENNWLQIFFNKVFGRM